MVFYHFLTTFFSLSVSRTLFTALQRVWLDMDRTDSVMVRVGQPADESRILDYNRATGPEPDPHKPPTHYLQHFSMSGFVWTEQARSGLAPESTSIKNLYSFN